MKEWIVVVIGCGAALAGSLVVLVSIIVYRYNKQKRKEKLQHVAQEMQQHKFGYLGLGANRGYKAAMSPFVPQLNYSEAEGNTSVFSHNQRHYRQQMKPAQPTASDEKANPYKDLLLVRKRSRSAESNESDEAGASFNNASTTAAEDDKGSVYGSEEDLNPKLAATTKSTIYYLLSYNPSSNTVNVKVEKVTNLPMRYRKHCSSFVKVSYLNSGKNKTTYYTSVLHKTLNPKFNELFQFKRTEDEEKEDALKLSVYVKYYLKEKLIGQTIVNVNKSLFAFANDIVMSENLETKKFKKKKHTENEALGQLFVLMQYQSDASRVKILIRKAENLPKINRPIGQGDYYVILNLMKENVPVTYKETKMAHGSNPVWNEPFLFDIPTKENIKDFWFQFIVMRGRISTKDGVIGHVLIGSDTTTTGIVHWEETLLPSCVEVAKWHSILPYR